MKKLILILAVVFTSYAFVGCGAPFKPTGKLTGQGVFEAKGCPRCHRTDGSSQEGMIDLAKIGDKRPAGYLEKWLKNPKKVKAGATMPFQSLSESERTAIVDYLVSLK